MALPVSVPGDEAHAASNHPAVELSAGAAVDAVLAATTVGTATASVLTAAVGSATSGVCTADASGALAAPSAQPREAAAWDAHLENPSLLGDTKLLSKEIQTLRRAALGLASERVNEFIAGCEFVSLGCFCAPSYALQLLGLKQNSYPFDWVRSSTEGIIHCLDAHFEDFLTYSTFWIQDSYTVFGGTRWGGSFWHHNLEAAITREDMVRRVVRFYGQGEVPACKPRFFVRCVNSTRELDSAVRLQEALRRALPQAQIFLLLIVDLQDTYGAMTLAGEDRLLIWRNHESQVTNVVGQGAESLRLCAEGYAAAVAFAIAYWAEGRNAECVSTFQSPRELAAHLQHWDGGDPARELFNPRRFYGQHLIAGLGEPLGGDALSGLLAKTQMQSVCIPHGTVAGVPFPVQCFGRKLLVNLPEAACGGHIVQLCCNEGAISASVFMNAGGNLVPIGAATVEEEPKQP